MFQLHPNGYRFADGHVVKLELLPKDSNTAAANSYGRTSNNQQNVTIENLELRLPVLESAGALGGLVQDPAAEGRCRRATRSPPVSRPCSIRGRRERRRCVPPSSPAYEECTTPNRTHGPPFGFSSCNPPQQTSDFLTVGTPDANAAAPEFTGVARYDVLVGNPGTLADEADVALTVSLTDVRNEGDLTDYTGELQANAVLRVTDRISGPAGDEPATVQDASLPVTVPCTATPGVAGSTCSVSTTMDAVMPGAVPEGKRSVWRLGQIEVYDGGSDGAAATPGNTLFAKQGVFIP